MPALDHAHTGAPIQRVNPESPLIAEPESIELTQSSGESAEEADHVQPPCHPKQHRTSASRRLSGRLPDRTSSSLRSFPSISSIASVRAPEATGLIKETPDHSLYPHHPSASQIVAQVAEWLRQEKAKRAGRKTHRAHAKISHAAKAPGALADHFRSDEAKHHKHHPARSDSESSDGGLALEKLEQILAETMSLGVDGPKKATLPDGKRDSYFPTLHRRSTRKASKIALRRGSTVGGPDTEHPDNELLVPSAEVILDNSKTLGYSGGAASSELDASSLSARSAKENEAWRQFKHEIVTLTHTLRIQGWRKVPIEESADIDVERLSGALTNAVYVVSPPKVLPQTPAIGNESLTSLVPKRPPPKLLLRIYGPQVEHLIDRESELQILRRLARKQIGPRLLGTFTNGRFEQFFYARTLTAPDLRNAETSKQIAKRMRELHDGIDLLKEERDDGPVIWKNWDKWVERCDEVITWLDRRIQSYDRSPVKLQRPNWTKYGLICGVEWSAFRATVDRYRTWLFEQYGGSNAVREHLVFAHNDTQYGNLLRIQPSGESPLMLPANEHKQLVVIDFEYASANPPGMEFANHFTEWCYNYHDSSKSYALNEKRYPTPDEQRRFLKAYVQHRPPSQTPSTAATPGPGGSISAFMLDSRVPSTPGGYAEEERARDEATEQHIRQLVDETRLWRIANSAQWVAWGIVQAKVPGMDEALEEQKHCTPIAQGSPHRAMKEQRLPSSHLDSDLGGPDISPLAEAAYDTNPESVEEPSVDGDDHEDEFDYLAYAQDRAMLFWGDVLQLGIVTEADLPKDLLQKIKMVPY